MDTSLQIVYKQLSKNFERVEQGHKTVLRMMKLYTKTAKYEISQKEDNDIDRDSGDNALQESYHHDNSAINSEDIPINHIDVKLGLELVFYCLEIFF